MNLQVLEHQNKLEAYKSRLKALQIDSNMKDAATDWLSGEIEQIKRNSHHARATASVELGNSVTPIIPQWESERKNYYATGS